MRTLEEIPAEVSYPANLPRESDLQTGTDLTSKTILVFCGGESEHAHPKKYSQERVKFLHRGDL